MEFTIVVPGSYILGDYQFPNYIYPEALLTILVRHVKTMLEGVVRKTPTSIGT